MDARVQFVTQTIIHAEARCGLPCVLEIKVVSFASDSGLVKLCAARSDAGQFDRAVGVRRCGEQAGQRIGEPCADLNVMGSAGGWNEYG